MIEKGFTLIELILVVAIIGILAGLLTYNEYVVKLSISLSSCGYRGFKAECKDASTTESVFSYDTISGVSSRVAIITTSLDGLISVQAQNIPELGSNVNLELVSYNLAL